MKKRRNNHPSVEVVWTDLKALCWWAAVGVRSSCGGSYSTEIDHIIESYADYVHLDLPGPIRFRDRPRLKPIANYAKKKTGSVRVGA